MVCACSCVFIWLLMGRGSWLFWCCAYMCVFACVHLCVGGPRQLSFCARVRACLCVFILVLMGCGTSICDVVFVVFLFFYVCSSGVWMDGAVQAQGTGMGAIPESTQYLLGRVTAIAEDGYVPSPSGMGSMLLVVIGCLMVMWMCMCVCVCCGCEWQIYCMRAWYRPAQR